MGKSKVRYHMRHQADNGTGTPLREECLVPGITKVQVLMDKIQVFFSKWLKDHLSRIYPNGFWETGVLGTLTPEQRRNVVEEGAKNLDELDFASLISVFLGNFRRLRQEIHIDAELSDLAKHVKKIRNRYAHKNAKSIVNGDYRKIKYHIDTLHQFLTGLGAEQELLKEVDILSGGETMIGASASAMANFPEASQKNRIIIKVDRNGNRVLSSEEESNRMILKSDTKAVDSVDTKKGATVVSRDEICESVRKYCNLVNFARTAPGLDGIFPSDAFILNRNKKQKFPVEGRGNWECLMLLPFKGDPEEAIKELSGMWNCPDDNVPYTSNGYMVWEFPPFVDVRPKEGEQIESIYPVGYFPLCFGDYITKTQNSNEHDDFLTCFSRSFVENFCVYDYVFTFGLDMIRGKKTELTICDVGVGVGGATYGLIWALRKRLWGDDSFRKIRVIGLDEDENALHIFDKLKSVIKDAWPNIEFDFVTKKVVFPRIGVIFDNVISYDFVITSKCFQKISDDGDLSGIKNLYKWYFDEAQKSVSENGVISVLEVDDVNGRKALESVLQSLSDCRVVIPPRQDEHGFVDIKRIGLCSPWDNGTQEEVFFSVVGSRKLAETFHGNSGCQAMNVQDADNNKKVLR